MDKTVTSAQYEQNQGQNACVKAVIDGKIDGNTIAEAD